MRKVNKAEFERLPAGTLYSCVWKDGDNSNAHLMIKTDTGNEYRSCDYMGRDCKVWSFNGALDLTPELPYDEELGYINKWLDEYKLDEYIKPDWSTTDVSSSEFNDDDMFMIYDEEEIKFMIKLLQTLCIDKNFNDKSIMNIIE